MRLILYIILFALLPLADSNACDTSVLMNELFMQLEQMGKAGEAQLGTRLDLLKAEEDWGEEKSNVLLLEIADSGGIIKNEQFRDSTIMQMLKMQTEPDLDCAKTLLLRDDILKREQAQWGSLITAISHRLSFQKQANQSARE